MKRPNNRALLMRRLLVGGLASAALAPLAPRANAATDSTRIPTPGQTLGPFYPRHRDERPAETGPDLLRDDGRRLLTRGTPIFLTGRVIDADGKPLSAARIEIWQCDANAIYHHPAGGAETERDPNFQGYGVAAVDADGVYRFRTILPVAYPGRTPHIHVRVETMRARPLATQLYLPGHPGNRRDFLFSRLSAAEQAAVSLKLSAGASSHPLARLTQQTAEADLVIG